MSRSHRAKMAPMRQLIKQFSKLWMAVPQPILRHSGCYKLLETPSFDPRNNVALCIVPKSKLRFSETGFSLADTEYKHTVCTSRFNFTCKVKVMCLLPPKKVGERKKIGTKRREKWRVDFDFDLWLTVDGPWRDLWFGHESRPLQEDADLGEILDTIYVFLRTIS